MPVQLAKVLLSWTPVTGACLCSNTCRPAVALSMMGSDTKDNCPVARFGASFYTRTDDRFAIADNEGELPKVNTTIDQM
jgi:hypothetical protein